MLKSLAELLIFKPPRKTIFLCNNFIQTRCVFAARSCDLTARASDEVASDESLFLSQRERKSPEFVGFKETEIVFRRKCSGFD